MNTIFNTLTKSIETGNYATFNSAYQTLLEQAHDSSIMRIIMRVHNQITFGASERILTHDCMTANHLHITENMFKRFLENQSQSEALAG